MTQKENPQEYPLRTMHQFLNQIEKETNRFKRGAAISILLSAVMLSAVAFVVYALLPRGFAASGVILLAVLVGVLVYSIYLMAFQYRFFRRWEQRLNRLNTLETELMVKLDEEKT